MDKFVISRNIKKIKTILMIYSLKRRPLKPLKITVIVLFLFLRWEGGSRKQK